MSREHTLHEMPLAESASSGSGSGSGSGSSTTFTRLAKLLHQSSALAGRSNLQPPPSADNAVQSLGRGLGLGLGDEAPRRLSWERCVYVIYNATIPPGHLFLYCPPPPPPSTPQPPLSALSTFTLTADCSGGELVQLANFIYALELES